jgi:transcriptional regulator with XRE-family HTH domain
MGEREVNQRWATWLRRRMRSANIATPTELGRESGVDQSVISRWLNEGRTPQVDQLRKIATPLRASMLDLLVAAGYVGPDEVVADDSAGSGKFLVSIYEAIDQDEALLDEAKQHLRNQYELLLRVAPQPSPSVAAGRERSRRAQNPPGEPRRLRPVARGGDPADREEISRRARKVREQHDNGEGTDNKK